MRSYGRMALDKFLIDAVAKAMYETNNFKRNWNDPKLNRAWQPHYRIQARIAIKTMEDWGKKHG